MKSRGKTSLCSLGIWNQYKHHRPFCLFSQTWSSSRPFQSPALTIHLYWESSDRQSWCLCRAPSRPTTATYLFTDHQTLSPRCSCRCPWRCSPSTAQAAGWRSRSWPCARAACTWPSFPTSACEPTRPRFFVSVLKASWSGSLTIHERDLGRPAGSQLATQIQTSSKLTILLTPKLLITLLPRSNICSNSFFANGRSFCLIQTMVWGLSRRLWAKVSKP